MLLARALLVQLLVILLKLHVILIDERADETILISEYIMQDPLLQVFVCNVRWTHELCLVVRFRHDLEVNILVIYVAAFTI